LLVALIPTSCTGSQFPDAAYLLERLASAYGGLSTPASQRRAIQRDLQALRDAQRIEVVDATAKPLRYRRMQAVEDDGPAMRAYARKLMHSVVADALPRRNLERVWASILAPDSGVNLSENKIRIVSDTLRLVPADIKEGVLAAVLEALSLSLTLHVRYRDATGARSEPLLHPQGLLQRGPRVYLYAIKDDDRDVVRMYALHRMLRAEVRSATAYQAPGFDLQRQIDS